MRSKTQRQPKWAMGRAHGRPSLLLSLGLLLCLAAGCSPPQPQTVTVAPGVQFVPDPKAGVQLLDVDLSVASVRPTVVASGFERKRANVIGDCKTVKEWATATGAIGGINAGYFGDTYDQAGRRKQIVGLLAVDGSVVGPANFALSTRYPGQKFLRSAVGFSDNGTPNITWATGQAASGIGHEASGTGRPVSGKDSGAPRRSPSPMPHAGSLAPGLTRYDAPVNPTTSWAWAVRSAVACGPRLFTNGERRITDREERLVSPGKLARAFVAYDRVAGMPGHFILGRADGMEFSDVADYLTAYFRERYGTVPHEAMCMDGGPSAQVVYKDPASGTLTDALPTGVLVPTAILLIPR